MDETRITEMLKGMPVGAFVVSKPKANGLIEILRAAALLKKMKNVTPFVGDFLAVHVCGVVSDDLMRRVVPSIAERYIEGYRVLQCPSDSPAPSSISAEAGPATNRFSFIELFAGIGMFRLGLERIGGVCKFSSEIAPVARKVYQNHFGDYPAGDITEYPEELIPDHDVLTAGFPCQSFSKAGTGEGLESSKGQLFLEVLRVLKAKQPKCFVLENVANLLTMDEGQTMAIILRSLQRCGYTVSHSVINSNLFVPQDRQRLYLVGWKASLYPKLEACEFPWEDVTKQSVPQGSRKRLRDILDASEGETVDRLRLTNSQWNLVRESPRYKANPSWRLAALEGEARTVMGSYKSSFQLYSEFVPIVTSSSAPPQEQIGAVPVRFYSVRECARLQGIPDEFSFEVDGVHHNAAYRLIGNAVCPTIVGVICKALLQWLQLLEQ